MTELRELHRSVVIAGWAAATEAAISALQEWRGRLTSWGNGGLVPRDELQAALALLDRAGQSEWAEWGAGLDLDELQRVLSGAEPVPGQTPSTVP